MTAVCLVIVGPSDPTLLIKFSFAAMTSAKSSLTPTRCFATMRERGGYEAPELMIQNDVDIDLHCYLIEID